MGVSAPPPRITGRGVWYALSRIAAPVVVGLVSIDVLIWLLAERVFGICAAIWCFF